MLRRAAGSLPHGSLPALHAVPAGSPPAALCMPCAAPCHCGPFPSQRCSTRLCVNHVRSIRWRPLHRPRWASGRVLSWRPRPRRRSASARWRRRRRLTRWRPSMQLTWTLAASRPRRRDALAASNPLCQLGQVESNRVAGQPALHCARAHGPLSRLPVWATCVLLCCQAGCLRVTCSSSASMGVVT